MSILVKEYTISNCSHKTTNQKHTLNHIYIVNINPTHSHTSLDIYFNDKFYKKS